MKKIYFIIISIILVLNLAVGCTEPHNTEPPMGSGNTETGITEGGGEISLPTFENYNEYLEYLQTIDLPENFVHANEFLNLGTFVSAVFLGHVKFEGDLRFVSNAYKYAYGDENNNETVLTFEMLPEDSPTDITKYLMERYEENNTQNQRFVEYNVNLFVNNNLLQCDNDNIWVTDICIGDMNYHYLGGNLYSIQFIRNGLLCTISWQNNNTNAQAWYDGSFLLERNNAVSKLIFASTATAGFNEICGKITTAVVE